MNFTKMLLFIIGRRTSLQRGALEKEELPSWEWIVLSNFTSSYPKNRLLGVHDLRMMYVWAGKVKEVCRSPQLAGFSALRCFHRQILLSAKWPKDDAIITVVEVRTERRHYPLRLAEPYQLFMDSTSSVSAWCPGSCRLHIEYSWN